MSEWGMLAGGTEVPQVYGRVDNFIDIVIVRTLFVDQDGEIRVGLCETSSHHASCNKTACIAVIP